MMLVTGKNTFSHFFTIIILVPDRTVEDVIASDDEEDTEHNLKLLAKVNDKKVQNSSNT